MPETVILNTGLDVLSHAAEAYLSTEAFPLNDALALHALETARSRLPGAVRKNAEDMDHMLIPKGPAGRFYQLGTKSMAIMKKTKNPEGAKAFWKWWFDDKQFGEWFRQQPLAANGNRRVGQRHRHPPTRLRL